MAVETNEQPAGEAVWTQDRLQNPHAVADKQRRVRDMFAAIAPRYDLNNRLHSLGIDQRWRKNAVKLSRLKADDVVVDVACGTGDLTLAYAWALSAIGDFPTEAPRLLGIDYTREMLPLALRKWLAIGFDEHEGDGFHDSRWRQYVAFINGDAHNLPLPDACCDVVSIAFGIRNVADPLRALREFRRVLRPGGRVVVLEFSKPRVPLLGAAYRFYFRRVLPRLGALVGGVRNGAYRYLHDSVMAFPEREQFVALMRAAGLNAPRLRLLTGGIAAVYRGEVPA